jgi:hypothetical protein
MHPAFIINGFNDGCGGELSAGRDRLLENLKVLLAVEDHHRVDLHPRSADHTDECGERGHDAKGRQHL